MKKININILMSLFFLFGCSNSQEPGYEYSPEMVYSQAYEAYSESKITPNGGSMLPAPKGSISRGQVIFNYGNTDEEKERAGKELVDPRVTSKERIQRGKNLYEVNCLLCHGVKGEGDGPVAKKYTEPPAFNGRALRNYVSGQLYHAIVKGYGDMPSHAIQLTEDDRWDLILYVHELQKVE